MRSWVSERGATYALLFGFSLMMVFDALLKQRKKIQKALFLGGPFCMLTVLLFRQSFSQQNEFLTIVKLHKKKKKNGIIFIDNCTNRCYTKKNEKGEAK